ncbi:MAG: ABC transporter ATP-binding protein [Ruminiclostridium sp.]|nr:ABC transporter ATP-binding protein [Ruminiclostridium sp.]
MHDEFVLQKRKFKFLRLMAYFKPFIPLLVLSVALALLVNAAILAKPYIIKLVIDDYIVAGNYDMGSIWLLGLLYFLMVLMGSVLGYMQTNILTYVGQKIMFNIRNQIFEHIQKMSMNFFDKNSTGRILIRVTTDVEALNELFSGVMVDLIRNFIMLAGIVIMIFTLDVRLAFVSISCVPIIAGIMVVYRIAARKNLIRMKGLLAKINGFLAENISGMKLVQIFNREKEKYEELRKLDGEYFKCSLREVILNSFSKPVVEIVNNLTIAVLVIFCMGRILEGSLEIGVLFAFIAYIKQFFEPISEISEKYTAIQSAIVSSERIFDILDKRDTQEDMMGGKPAGRLKGAIRFENVWFAYENEAWVLKDVSFSISPGETAAFVGATGSGKTTIISLIMRFYDIQKGRILIDGQDIREYRLEDLRKQITVVLQDVFLFAGDIKSNIRLNNSITDDEIECAARYVSADSFIESLPGKYDEEVKERGCTFSAGQKQLISFVRAVAFNPAVLVLDEATASIDTSTEQAIREAMSKISRNRTSIIIAHRLSTIRSADKILVMHKGRIRETGNHDELMALGGIYCRLCKAQTEGGDLPRIQQ